MSKWPMYCMTLGLLAMSMASGNWMAMSGWFVVLMLERRNDKQTKACMTSHYVLREDVEEPVALSLIEGGAT